MTRSRAPLLTAYITPLFIGFAILGSVLFGIFSFLQKQEQDYKFVRENIAIRRHLYHAIGALQEAESGKRGYLLTGDRHYLASYDTAGPAIADDFKALASANDSYLTELEPLRQLILQKLSITGRIVDLEIAGKHDEALVIIAGGSGRDIMERIQTRTDALLDSQFNAMDERLNWAKQIGLRLRYGALAAILLAAGLAFVAVVQLRNRLANLMSTSNDLVSARDDLLNANAELLTEARLGAQLGEQLRQSQKMEAIGQLTGEPPRVYRRVICSTTRRPYRVCSGLHRTPPLLLRG